MLRNITFAVGFLLATYSAAVSAEQGTANERESCRRDTVRLCKDVVPEDGPMLNCLKTNRERLSVACRTVLEEHHQ